MSPILDLFLTFAKVGAFTFGGGYAMISLLDHACVEQKGWLTADELMDVTVIAESTPGPIAINCATYTGYKVAGMAGAVSATVGIILPSFLLLFLISRFFEGALALPLVAKAFRGIRIAVAILIVQAAVKMIGNLYKKSPHKKLQLPMVGLFFLLTLGLSMAGTPVPTIPFILVSGLVGFLLFRRPNKNKKEGSGL